MDPIGQLVHVARPPVEYVPAAQKRFGVVVVGSVDLPASVSGQTYPAGHGWQTPWPVVGLNVPPGHAKQSNSFVAPVVARYVPARHFVCVVAPVKAPTEPSCGQKDPIGQDEHSDDVAPPGENDPAAHCPVTAVVEHMLPAGHNWQLIWPVFALYVPASQAVAVMAPEGHFDPAGHMTQIFPELAGR
jgi:hypothetical protein